MEDFLQITNQRTERTFKLGLYITFYLSSFSMIRLIKLIRKKLKLYFPIYNNDHTEELHLEYLSVQLWLSSAAKSYSS